MKKGMFIREKGLTAHQRLIVYYMDHFCQECNEVTIAKATYLSQEDSLKALKGLKSYKYIEFLGWEHMIRQYKLNPDALATGSPWEDKLQAFQDIEKRQKRSERILKDKRLTANHLTVFFYLERFGESYGAMIAKATEMESSTCARTIKALREYGYVIPTKQEGRNNFYEINKDAYRVEINLRDLKDFMMR